MSLIIDVGHVVCFERVVLCCFVFLLCCVALPCLSKHLMDDLPGISGLFSLLESIKIKGTYMYVM